MGEFTAQEIQNIANAALDFYLKGDPIAQSIQDKPLLKALKGKQKTFPGGKDLIRGNVIGDYSTTFLGYQGDDTVTYTNPANIKQFTYNWFELHAGIQFTYTELKKDGISVSDSLTGENTSEHSERDKTVISNIFQSKLDDMMEGTSRSWNLMSWRDGAQSARNFPGIQYLLSTTPTTGSMAGIDRANNTWWRNRYSTIAASVANQTLTKTLRKEVRQLRRYGGKPTLVLCGSEALERLEAEIHEKGTYTQEGFVNKGQNDIGMADIAMKGVGTFVYDPTLDDEGLEDYIYMIDPRHIQLYVMEGEDMKKHAPARPTDKYVFYRAVTWTGALIANKLNCHGVYHTSGIV